MTGPTLIQELKQSLGEAKVFPPEAPEYEALIKRWADSAARRAAVVVLPITNLDVSHAICLATKYHVPLAVAGGRHSTGAECSSEGGMVVDMRNMRDVTVNTVDKTITCGGGSKWIDVDQAAAKHGLATVGGTVNDTGVGGLTLGGGYGWLTGQLGIVLDRVLALEVVLADGRVVTASATSEPDLFWAMRGAGAAFGAVTKFTFQCVEKTEPIYGGCVFWPVTPEGITHLVNFSNEVHARGNPRTAMMIGFTTIPEPQPVRILLAACFHDGPEEEGAKIFAPLVDDSPVPPIMKTLQSMPYEVMNGILSAAAIPGGRHTSKGATFMAPLAPETFQRLVDGFERLVEEVPEAGSGGVCLFEFYQTAQIARFGHAETAFPNRGLHQNATIAPHWLSETHDGRMRTFARDAMGWVREAQDQAGQPVAEYINYDGLGTPAEKAYGPNYPRLRALKARYDPHNVFTKRHGLGADLPAKESVAEAEAKAVAEPATAVNGEAVVNDASKGGAAASVTAVLEVN